MASAAAAAGKSRFWGAANDSDDSESDGSESSKSSGAEGKATAAGARGGAAGTGRWAVESDSESEEENRVARSVKDRTWEGMQAIIKAINNSLKINSWVSLQEGKAVMGRHGWFGLLAADAHRACPCHRC
jgi:translation initiation factor 3 subunit C